MLAFKLIAHNIRSNHKEGPYIRKEHPDRGMTSVFLAHSVFFSGFVYFELSDTFHVFLRTKGGVDASLRAS